MLPNPPKCNKIKSKFEFGWMNLDKKKALILYGSPHKSGHTKKALDEIIVTLQNEFEFTFIDAFKAKVAPCVDCGSCKTRESCVSDDFADIDTAIRISELIIIATPIYNLSFPAPLKAIFDRTQLYFNMKVHLKKNPFKQQKAAILVATCGARDLDCEEIILKQLQLFLTLINAKLIKSVFISNTDASPPATDNA